MYDQNFYLIHTPRFAQKSLSSTSILHHFLGSMVNPQFRFRVSSQTCWSGHLHSGANLTWINCNLSRYKLFSIIIQIFKWFLLVQLYYWLLLQFFEKSFILRNDAQFFMAQIYVYSQNRIFAFKYVDFFTKKST